MRFGGCTIKVKNKTIITASVDNSLVRFQFKVIKKYERAYPECWRSWVRTPGRVKRNILTLVFVDRLFGNRDNVPKWRYMSALGFLSNWGSTMNIQLRVLVYYKEDIILIMWHLIQMFSPWYGGIKYSVDIK